MKKKSSKFKWLFLFIVLAVAAALVAVGTSGGEQGIEVTTDSIETGDITATVTATGKIQPEVIVSISSEVPGEITELAVKDGDVVEKGDLLVRVNPDTLEAQVKQQEASLAATKAGAAQSKAEMLQTELDLKRIEELHDKGFATKEQLDQSETSLEVRKAAYSSSLHQIERQEMQLREAKDQLAKATTFSPIDGRIVRLNSEVGDRVVGTGQFAGTQIMQVANLENMEVRVEVSEADIINIEINDSATIEIDAFPDQKFKGSVTSIANSAVTTGERSQEELTTFEVRVRLTDPIQRLRPGMTATAEIETQRVENVVRAPLGAVVVRPMREIREALGLINKDSAKQSEKKKEPSDDRKKGDKRSERARVVFVDEDGVAKLRKVETGIADADFIEITKGISEGDTIITGSYRALTRELKDGTKITITEEKDFTKKGD